MKIKTVKEMRLDELIKWGYENGIKSEIFTTENDTMSYFSRDGFFFVDDYTNPDERFKVEVEEEITEDTVLPFVTIRWDDGFKRYESFNTINCSLSGLVNNNVTFYPKFIYLQNDDGSIGELIWKDGKMVGGGEG